MYIYLSFFLLFFLSLIPPLSSNTHAHVESLYFPLKDNSPFKHLMSLFSELIDLCVFSYTLYLSTLIARGDTLTPIIPALPFFRGEGFHPPASPMELDPPVEGLNLAIPLSVLPKYKNILKKPSSLDIKVEREDEGTISPRLPSAFGSQTNLLATLGDYSSTAPFGHDIKVRTLYMHCTYMYTLCICTCMYIISMYMYIDVVNTVLLQYISICKLHVHV